MNGTVGGMGEDDAAATSGAEALRWLGVVDDLHEAIVAADSTNLILYLNRAAETLLGWSSADLVGQPLTMIMPERFRAQHQAGFTRFVATREVTVMGRPLRVPAQRGDGTEIDVELVVTRAHLPGGAVLVGLFRDVSDRVELEGGGDLAELLVAALAEAGSLAEAIPRVLEGLGESLNWDLVQLWLVEPDVTSLRRRATWSRDTARTAGFAGATSDTLQRGAGLPGRVWASAAPAWIEDVAVATEFPRAATAVAIGLHSAFAFPLVCDERVVGVIEMFSAQAHGVSQALIKRVAALGARLGGFIERRVGEEDRLALLELERIAREQADRARARLAFLSEASNLLSQSLDLEITLAQVASLAVPALGNWCVIHLVVDQEVAVAAVAHADPAKVAALRLAHERYPVDLAAAEGVGQAMTTGTIVRHEHVTGDVLHAIAQDDRHLLRHIEFGSVVTVPLKSHDRRFGTITVATNRSHDLSDDTVDTVVELSLRAAMAIDNARLHQDLRLQAAMLRTRGEAGVEGQLVVAPNGDMISHNRRFAEMWNLPAVVLNVRSDNDALTVAAGQVVDPQGFRDRVEQLYASRASARDEVLMRDGRVFDRVGSPLFEDGAYLGYGWYFRDVTEHKKIERDLAAAAATSAALAHTLQQSLLPPSLPNIPGLRLVARYVPSSGLEVGGDFYDVFPLGRETWGLVVGDVCGHGAEAAAVTSFARYTLRATAAQTRSPARALRLLNDAMLRQDSDAHARRFVTVANARVRVRRGSVRVTLAIGGHPLPIVRRASGATTLVGRPGTLLGILDHVDIHDVELSLDPGDCMVIVTDGVLEARRGGDQFGQERLLELISDSHMLPADELADAITTAVDTYANGTCDDDIAVLIMAVS